MTNRLMKPYKTDLPIIHLNAGEICITDKPTLVTTVLGSCVSVTMHCGRLKIGAICHGLLPSCGSDCGQDCEDQLKYVDCSIEFMLKNMLRYGITKNELSIKLFGGGDVLLPKESAGKNKTVGKQNLQIAKEIFRKEGLTIVNSDVGGYRGRRIYFYTHTGEVLLRRLRKQIPNPT